jgi:hypothetical protein
VSLPRATACGAAPLARSCSLPPGSCRLRLALPIAPRCAHRSKVIAERTRRQRPSQARWASVRPAETPTRPRGRNGEYRPVSHRYASASVQTQAPLRLPGGAIRRGEAARAGRGSCDGVACGRPGESEARLTRRPRATPWQSHPAGRRSDQVEVEVRAGIEGTEPRPTEAADELIGGSLPPLNLHGRDGAGGGRPASRWASKASPRKRSTTTTTAFDRRRPGRRASRVLRP